VLRALALTTVLIALSVGSARAEAPPALPASAQVAADRAQLLTLAEQGVRRVQKVWWSRSGHWYKDTTKSRGLASIWSSVHLFNALNALASADRTRLHVRMVERFANAADRLYWNPVAGHVPHTRRHIGGYSPVPGWRGTAVHTYYDDNGWLGLAFFNAWQLTGKSRYLGAAERAFAFTAVTGWATQLGGGVWWDTRHASRSSEGIASNILLGALLLKATGRATYLRHARMYIAWSNAKIWDPAARLYERDPHSPILMRYVQSPIMAGEQTLCQATGDQSLCAAAAALGNAQLREFPAAANHGPQYDSIYLQWMLYQYSLDHDPRWYALAFYNANRALTNSGNKAGLFLKDWDGDRAPGESSFQIEAATLSLFASVAAAVPPQ
jgi:Glycosyl hydrolase family 76